jgi:hypothetical protein
LHLLAGSPGQVGQPQRPYVRRLPQAGQRGGVRSLIAFFEIPARTMSHATIPTDAYAIVCW